LEITKSLIIPCKDEHESINKIITGFYNAVDKDTEILIVVDDESDPTINSLPQNLDNLRICINDLGSGPAYAIQYGINQSLGTAICIAMGDGSDDPNQVKELFSLINRGVSVAVATRYSKGGQYVGSSTLKYLMSRFAGVVLYYLFFIRTKDPTNMFKAYSKDFLNNVKIESKNGFTLGLEMSVKAKLNKEKIAEIPTIWIDRAYGETKFSLRKFLPSYLYWVFRLALRRK
tara:strand:+ start:1835 stop:2527 length:693 start_codon:yes stop_codon:yes gene_type:complete